MADPIYFLKLEVENFRCFKKKTTLDLSDGNGNWKKWTVILSENGRGKTTLLQLLAACELAETGNPWLAVITPVPSKSEIEFERESLGYTDGYVKVYTNSKQIDNQTIELLFYDDASIHGFLRYKEAYFDNLRCFGYGANRMMGATSLAHSKGENSETLYHDDALLINAEEWLLQLDYVASKESEVKEYAANRRDQVKQILLNLLPDIEEIRFTTPTRAYLSSSVEFLTPYGWVNIHELSLGYKTMVAWLVDLAARMFDYYPESPNPLTEPAIVLVDEIDLHLHPKWQRKIFNYLSEKFPKTQFIVTAHSPLIVQSAPNDANIVLLRKEGDHVVIDNDIKNVQNWRIDQIMSSDLFGIESSRSPEIEKTLQERKTLLQKTELSPQEQQRLNELNQQIRNLPTAENPEDIEAMDIIRRAAEYLRKK
jgi:Predicted ATP-binding protein involved in virulence